MYASLLTVLLMGIVPLSSAADRPDILTRIAIAPPALSLTLQGHLSASGVLILDAQSGQVVFSKQADVHLPMASTTKLMTALLIAENHTLTEIVTIPEDTQDVMGNQVYLSPGDRYTVGDLLSALLIPSANDAAVALAQHHSGSVSAFVEAMNERAAQLGLHDTSFANPTGLDHPDQYSTPRDMAWLTKFVMQQPAIAERLGRRWQRIVSQGGKDMTLNHTHALLHTSLPILAGKTGTTDDARQCLISVVEHDGRQYIIVLLHSDERYADMNVILEAMNIVVA